MNLVLKAKGFFLIFVLCVCDGRRWAEVYSL